MRSTACSAFLSKNNFHFVAYYRVRELCPSRHFRGLGLTYRPSRDSSTTSIHITIHYAQAMQFAAVIESYILTEEQLGLCECQLQLLAYLDARDTIRSCRYVL